MMSIYKKDSWMSEDQSWADSVSPFRFSRQQRKQQMFPTLLLQRRLISLNADDLINMYSQQVFDQFLKIIKKFK